MTLPQKYGSCGSAGLRRLGSKGLIDDLKLLQPTIPALLSPATSLSYHPDNETPTHQITPVTPASISPAPPPSTSQDPPSKTIQSTPAAPALTPQLPRTLAHLLPHNATSLKEFQQSAEPSHDATNAPAAVCHSS